ncbi:MAG TPA: CopG family antitoxin [Blastocatellia bacterium]|nr:CopG family antitoxin [Blastocatellia bacterium]
MAKSKVKKLPKFESLDKLVEFFERNDTSKYWNEMPEVHFDISIKKKTYLVAIDDELAREVSEIARSKRVTSEKLINSWIKDRLSKAS